MTHVGEAPYDVVIRGGLWFDGTGGPPRRCNLGIRDARLSRASASPLPEAGCDCVIDASGHWVLPGFIDIHTHYDAEVLFDAGLRESVRHGVTTVMLGSCSLSTIFADNEDVADLFSRVEAVPRRFVLEALQQRRTWTDARGYVAALEALPLGPNVASMVGHSDVRAAVLGLDRATTPGLTPTAAELGRMRDLLAEGLDAGLTGLSGMDAPIDRLDGERFRSRALPSTYATWSERRALIDVVRARGRIVQSAPNPKSLASALRYFLASSGGFGRRSRVPTSLLVAADAKSFRGAHLLIRASARVANALMGAAVVFQHLPVPFEVYSDGIDLPVFEEFGAGTAALHIREQLERNALLADVDYRRSFRKQFDRKGAPGLWHKDFYDATIVACPETSAVGKTFGQVADERGIHPLDAFLDVLVDNGERNVRWTTVLANDRPKQLNAMAADRYLQMGFSDAGAHLRNMAFYNAGVRLLKRVRDAAAAGHPFLSVPQAVHRLTGELGDWFGLDAGHLRVGDRADFVVLDPAGLDDSVNSYGEAAVPFYDGLLRMVNDSDAAIAATGIAGRVVYERGRFADGYGASRRTGSYLRPGPRGDGTPEG